MHRITISGKKAVSLAPYVLVELVLGVLVFVVLFLALNNIADGTDFHQQFFAKDNAYLAEVLQATPNGNVRLGYLWSSENFHFSLAGDHIGVSQRKGTVNINERTKYFGTSAAVRVEQNAFTPQAFQWELDTGTVRRLRASEQFLPVNTCPESADPITSVTVQGHESGFPAGTMAPFALDAQNNVAAALSSGNAQQSSSALRVQLFAVQGDNEQQRITVYTGSGSSKTRRFVCLLGLRAGVVPLLAAEAPAEINAAQYDLTIVFTAKATGSVGVGSGLLRQTVESYQKGDTRG